MLRSPHFPCTVRATLKEATIAWFTRDTEEKECSPRPSFFILTVCAQAGTLSSGTQCAHLSCGELTLDDFSHSPTSSIPAAQIMFSFK
jgi:hypothetical protein